MWAVSLLTEVLKDQVSEACLKPEVKNFANPSLIYLLFISLFYYYFIILFLSLIYLLSNTLGVGYG